MENKPARRPSNADRKAALLKKFEEWIQNGDTVEQALEKFTVKQYDFLIDQGVDFDALLLTPEQREAAKKATKAPRTVKPGGYNKRYPQAKQDLYNALVELVKSRGAEVTIPAKCNFRDLDFTIDGVKYKIVLSNPRT